MSKSSAMAVAVQLLQLVVEMPSQLVLTSAMIWICTTSGHSDVVLVPLLSGLCTACSSSDSAGPQPASMALSPEERANRRAFLKVFEIVGEVFLGIGSSISSTTGMPLETRGA